MKTIFFDLDGTLTDPKPGITGSIQYVIGVLKNSPHWQAGEAYLEFLRSAEGQDTYAKFGFVKADGKELKLKPIN
jgi:ABC-type Fe3+ transport system substrate-binding protein